MHVVRHELIQICFGNDQWEAEPYLCALPPIISSLGTVLSLSKATTHQQQKQTAAAING